MWNQFCDDIYLEEHIWPHHNKNETKNKDEKANDEIKIINITPTVINQNEDIVTDLGNVRKRFFPCILI